MIKEVYYEEIDPLLITMEEAGEFYYHTNLIGIHSMFHNDYETYEINQINIRNKIVRSVIDVEIFRITLELIKALLVYHH